MNDLISFYNDYYLNINTVSDSDILFYLIKAYSSCCFDSEGPPSSFEITDNLIDEILLSDRETFLFGEQNYLLTRYEIMNVYFVEFLLDEYMMHYESTDIVECGNAQNILIREMRSFEWGN